MAKEILELVHMLAMAMILASAISVSWTLTEHAVKRLLEKWGG